MEKFIAIIGAMDEEVLTLSQKLHNRREHGNPFLNIPIFTGKLGDKSVVIARCGIGKVNAALITQYLVDRFPLRAIINTGVAGGVSSDVKIGDIVISTAALHHDVDATNFGYKPGVIPGFKKATFPADSGLIDLAVQAASKGLNTERIHKGLIVSGDQFVSSEMQKKKILTQFPKTLCVEMEGAAIAQGASLNSLPYLIIRAISDQADNTAPQDFDAYLVQIIPTLNRVIQELILLI